MSELKFRIFDVETNKMIYEIDIIKDGYTFYITMKGNLIRHEGNIFYDCNGNRFKIMQYTGLKDKNGKEIYKGDIVKYKYPKRDYQIHDPYLKELMEPYIKICIGEIIFKDGTYIVKNNNNEYYDIDLYYLCTGTYNHDDMLSGFQMRSEKEWHDPNDLEESNLLYLLEEYNLKDENELIEYLSGCEVIGNVFQNPDLLEEK